MKRLICLLLMFVLAAPALADAPYTAESKAYIVTDSPGERLNLRSGPGGKYESLGKYYAGVEVELCGEQKSGFVRIRIGDAEGWAANTYLSTAMPEPEIPQCNVSNSGGTGANLRTKPSKLFGSVMMLCPNGTPVQVLGVLDSGWLHVQVEEKTGYMLGSLVNTRFSFVDKVLQEHVEPGSMYIGAGHAETRVPMHAAPDASSAVLAELLSSKMVIVQEFNSNGWARIWSGALEGWVQSVYCVPLENKPVDGRRAIAGVSLTGASTYPVYSKPESAVILAHEAVGSIFHVEAILPRGWVYGWSEKVTQGGFVRSENLAEPLYMADTMYVINPDPAERLNLRSAPNKQAKSLAKFWNGMQVLVVSYNADHSWAEVVAGDLQGWMDMSYLTYDGYDAIPVQIKVTKGTMAWASPSGNSWQCGKLEQGDHVQLLGVTPDGWVYAGFDGVAGWVKNECLEDDRRLAW